VSRRILLSYLGLVLVVLAALEIPLGVQNARTERRDLSAKVDTMRRRSPRSPRTRSNGRCGACWHPWPRSHIGIDRTREAGS
jgi:hypothetical protein